MHPKEQSKIYNKRWYNKNKRKRKLQIRKYQKLHRMRLKRAAKKYRKLKRVKVLMKKRANAWRRENPTRYMEIIHRYYRTTYGRFSQSKYKAKQKGYSFTLTLEQFTKFIKTNCFYCNCRPTPGVQGFWLDRVNNDRGYTMQNVVPCCKRCNVMKNDMSTVQFKKHLLKIVRILKVA